MCGSAPVDAVRGREQAARRRVAMSGVCQRSRQLPIERTTKIRRQTTAVASLDRSQNKPDSPRWRVLRLQSPPSPSGDLSEKVTDHQGDQRSSEWLLLHEVRQLVGLVCCRPSASPQRLTRRVKQSRVSLPRLTRRAGRHRSIIAHRESIVVYLLNKRGSGSQVPGRSAGQPTVTIPRSP
jgi:hypothetical protein